ncbi:MAG: carbamoyltransferase HypF, partial [candidate division WOR-3 bacterium]
CGAVEVLPGVATCLECLGDIHACNNRRGGYEFTNCTLCGPRYSIIEALPYDRTRTTMKSFRMCLGCQREYEDPLDRRFHAQPNCCPDCGPRYVLRSVDREVCSTNNPVRTAAELLAQGKILAIKSIGGFHIACDATNENAVSELRRRKTRPDKPFAIMCPDLITARSYALVETHAAELLESSPRPIVLLPKLPGKSGRHGLRPIAPSVAPGLRDLGIMLPYAPVHYLLFNPLLRRKHVSGPSSEQDGSRSSLSPCERLTALVMTSANAPGEPVTMSFEEVSLRLGGVVDYVLDNNRPIANRCDDSVLLSLPLAPQAGHRQPNTAPQHLVVRRSKGYVPSPIVLDTPRLDLSPVLAVGAEQKNTFALAARNRVFISPHIGDLNTATTLEFFGNSLRAYECWFGIKPRVLACDLHPDYLSTRLAEDLAEKRRLRLVRVQHHHAHVVSVMAEHALPEPVLGLALDGTGLGTDGLIWGCEFLKAWYGRFERLGHLRYLPLAGGETAIAEPWRIAAGYLLYLFGDSFCLPETLAKPSGRNPKPQSDHQLALSSIKEQLRAGTNVVFTSSAGRIFDAVSAITGICTKASFDGQAPALLESAAGDLCLGQELSCPQYASDSDLVESESGTLLIDPAGWLSRVVRDSSSGIDPTWVSRRFHAAFIKGLSRAAITLCERHELGTVCLSGGVLQNRIVLQGLHKELQASGLAVYTNLQVPVNDGGVSLGQALVADARLKPVSG